MLRKNFFKILTAALFVVLFAFPALGAMNDADFVELCKSGSPQQISEALRAGANVNAKDNDGWTALMSAVKINKNPEAIKMLLNAGADVNAKDRNDRTALMEAVMAKQNPEVIKMLFNAGADVKARDKQGRTALDYALQKTKKQLLEALEAIEKQEKYGGNKNQFKGLN